MKRNSIEEFLNICAVLLIFLALAIPFGSSTKIDYEEVNNDVFGPGDPSEGVVVTEFVISDGGDTIFRGDLGIGEELYSFENNSTMYLNQTDGTTKGLNGFDNGEDIFNVSLIHSEGNKENISGELVGNFSKDIAFTDGGNKSDGVFNGDEEAVSNSEALVLSNTTNSSFLNISDFVVAEGKMNLSNFSENVRFADGNDNRFFNGSEALIRNQTDSIGFLNDSDDVIFDGEAGLEKFPKDQDSNTVRFADYNHDNEYDSDSAIIRYNDNSRAFGSNEEVIVNGSAGLERAETDFLSYYNNTPGGFTDTEEQIYWEGGQIGHNKLVNISDVRIGNATISTEGYEMIRNDTLWNSSLALGKDIYEVTSGNTGYGGDGTFRVLEFDGSDSAWNPGSGDQEVLIYDPSGDESTVVSGESSIPDIYLYDTNPGNTNISNTMELGDRFNDTQANVDEITSYEPDVNVTFDGSDPFYNASKDNITLNISHDGNSEVIILGPEENRGEIGYEGTLHNGGQMMFWNASEGNNEELNGYFLDMDENNTVTEGDLRVGGWEKELMAGEVSSGDVDIGLNLTTFTDNSIKVLDKNSSGKYFPDDGTADGQREAIINSSDYTLDSEDKVIRSGVLDQSDFGNDTRYSDFDGDGMFEAESAIVEDQGGDRDLLEDEDVVLKSGNASLKNLSEEVKYVENGSNNKFELGSSESIIWDSDMDGKISKGFLDSYPDIVKVSGKANLHSLPQPPNEENQSGLVFVDSNRTGRYNQGEDILNITLITNGSASNKINGTEIFNFADTTKYNNNSFYQDGDAIVNDTDMNSVFKDVFNSLEIRNVFNEDEYYYRNVSPSELNGGLKLYRDSSGDSELGSSDTFVADLSFGSADENNPPYTWNASGLGQKISDEKRYFVSFDSRISLPDAVFGFKANISDVGMNSTDEFNYNENLERQLVDSYPPRIAGASTGVYYSGNNSKEMRDKVHVKIRDNLGIEETFDYRDFEIMLPGFEILKAETSGKDKYNATNGDVILTLNDSLETNHTPKIRLANPGSDKEPGIIEDEAQNKRLQDNATARDGLRPLINDISYQDRNVDGTIDLLEIAFSERINYTRFDASGWEVESNGVPCIQALSPGKEASFCSTVDRKINVTSGNTSSVFKQGLNLSSMEYVNSSNQDSSKYEIEGELLDVVDSNTRYGNDGGFVVHEYNYSGNGEDNVWNPNNTADQDVLVYSVNGTDLTPGDILIYDERSSNNNITINEGEEFTLEDIKSSETPSNTYSVSSEVGYIGSGGYNPEDHNVSVNISYNSPSFSELNSTFVTLASNESSLGIGKSGTFTSSGSLGFWNTSGSENNPGNDGIFVDVDNTGDISDGDVRLGEWTLPKEKSLYRHEIASEVDSSTAGSSLNNTLLNLSSSKYRSLSTENIIGAEIVNSTRELDVSGNITSVNMTDGGGKLNISFNSSKYDINLSNSDKVSVNYYSKNNVNSRDVEYIELNTMASGGSYDGLGSLNQDNTSVVEINATALEGITGTSEDEPVMNFTVLNNSIVDQSSNTLTNATGIELTDEAGPAVTQASVKDADNNAELDRVNLNFSENLDDQASSFENAFNLSNGTIENIWIRNSNSSNLSLNVSSVGGTAFKPNITVENDTIRDKSGNTPQIEQNFTQVKDRANPILMNAEIDPYNSTSDYTFVDLQFSEHVNGDISRNESVNLSDKKLEFNQTSHVNNKSLNFSEQLQTGDSPNITVASGLSDDSNNRVELHMSENVSVNTFRKRMAEGWNFVSFPIATTSTPNISEVVNVSKIDVVWTREDGNWSTYDPEAPKNDFNTVKGGKGYYFKTKESFVLASNVENKVESSISDPDDLLGTNISDGWNLIGSIQEYRQNPTNNSAFASFEAVADPVLEQKYNNGSKILQTSPPLKNETGYVNGKLKPGDAYWAEVSNSGENATYRIPISDIP